jgi:HK97 family phage major capsid protein
MERVDIKLNPIYAYPKTTQEILDFSEVDILGWLSSEIPTPSPLPKKPTL